MDGLTELALSIHPDPGAWLTTDDVWSTACRMDNKKPDADRAMGLGYQQLITRVRQIRGLDRPPASRSTAKSREAGADGQFLRPSEKVGFVAKSPEVATTCYPQLHTRHARARCRIHHTYFFHAPRVNR